MKIRTAADVIAIAKARGFKIRIEPGPPPMPVLVCKGNRDSATEALMSALKSARVEIMELISEGKA